MNRTYRSDDWLERLVSVTLMAIAVLVVIGAIFLVSDVVKLCQNSVIARKLLSATGIALGVGSAIAVLFDSILAGTFATLLVFALLAVTVLAPFKRQSVPQPPEPEIGTLLGPWW